MSLCHPWDRWNQRRLCLASAAVWWECGTLIITNSCSSPNCEVWKNWQSGVFSFSLYNVWFICSFNFLRLKTQSLFMVRLRRSVEPLEEQLLNYFSHDEEVTVWRILSQRSDFHSLITCSSWGIVRLLEGAKRPRHLWTFPVKWAFREQPDDSGTLMSSEGPVGGASGETSDSPVVLMPSVAYNTNNNNNNMINMTEKNPLSCVGLTPDLSWFTDHRLLGWWDKSTNFKTSK